MDLAVILLFALRINIMKFNSHLHRESVLLYQVEALRVETFSDAKLKGLRPRKHCVQTETSRDRIPSVVRFKADLSFHISDCSSSACN